MTSMTPPVPPARAALPFDRLATALAQAGTPRVEFQAALRDRLLLLARQPRLAEGAEPTVGYSRAPKLAGRLVGRSRNLHGRRRVPPAGLGVRVALAGLAGLLVLSGVGWSAHSSLPGSPFYGLKRAAESVQLSLSRGDGAKGRRELGLARTRLSEVRALTAAGRPSRVPATLSAMDALTRRGRDHLTDAERAGDATAAALLGDFARQQGAALDQMMPLMPTADLAIARTSRRLLAAMSAELAAESGAARAVPGAAAEPPVANNGARQASGGGTQVGGTGKRGGDHRGGAATTAPASVPAAAPAPVTSHGAGPAPARTSASPPAPRQSTPATTEASAGQAGTVGRGWLPPSHPALPGAASSAPVVLSPPTADGGGFIPPLPTPSPPPAG